ncbi:DUF1801 domain-containing protein [Flammeovirga yaeyamensis]|uniref:DUF1801 domain-containing protein n=1 Tax=Flammeovirga yaeyamensis TaxID=367791 RepID=A0AAX1MZ97_9BACT|nr:DUF1801 domain-containing protein [Flammeovirga yaeyamensis]MBB3696029.1 hypothetical protein [Flammeovirga yaeyamensis]NMF34715.1 DUF1801 domain-containing protein [Flammeovirga yaeyamensis]QWG00456.1 DUF1801 domain-containing protein [Flammeovirga yaeyamensis]
MNDKDTFYLNQPEPNSSCFLALRSLLIGVHPDIEETIKYGIPCFSFRKKPLCYLWKDKKTDEPYLLWVDGLLLHHNRLETGSRKKMKILRVNPHEDLEIELIQSILKTAIELRIN